ncbi:hypothetical protein SAMN05216270_101691 [Glycomyces harbinensis]|uniref:Uncharacterized protein n=1 Tax=Glycomyces harbinensis TaxID=58114 RepID=A0A1G6RVW5_9ACTN|nr:hypothetical protein SAMN05216270_101691 [Glycomyces harbinensis]
MRGAAAVAAISAVFAAGACSGGAAEEGGAASEPGSDAVAEAERLYQILNESWAIEDELLTIELRVAKRCMEDAGFQVHDPAVFQETDFSSYGTAGFLTDAPVRAVPTPEAAEEWGFGVWTEFVGNPGNEELAEELLTPEARAAFNMPEGDYEAPDESEWDAEGEEYQSEWIEAYTGSPAIPSDVKGPEPDFAAPMGGCELEMVETIYGEPYTVDIGGEGDSDGDGVEEDDESYTATHEPSPVAEIEDFEDYGNLLARLDGEDVAFETCLIDSGYEGWELGDSFYPPLWEYFGSMYDPAYFEQYGEEGLEVPEAPEEIPGDFMGVLELERAMAVDFAACGRESGLREAIVQGWAAILVEAYQPLETDIVAWQEKMQGHLDDAQDYLQG